MSAALGGHKLINSSGSTSPVPNSKAPHTEGVQGAALAGHGVTLALGPFVYRPTVPLGRSRAAIITRDSLCWLPCIRRRYG